MTCPLHNLDPCHVCGINRVRAALTVAPQRHHTRDTDPDPVRARAIQRARTDRQNAKDTP